MLEIPTRFFLTSWGLEVSTQKEVTALENQASSIHLNLLKQDNVISCLLKDYTTNSSRSIQVYKVGKGFQAWPLTQIMPLRLLPNYNLSIHVGYQFLLPARKSKITSST
uniref:Uncharacterized protein n=1 Tax=Micrurus paraensis TaxID=1970185 RepID=A0A2D4L1S9_9SAUR